MKTRFEWNRMALSAGLVVILVAVPAIAAVSTGYNRGQQLVGATRSGNPSLSLGTDFGTNKVFRFDSNNDGYPELIQMLARGSVKNQSRRTQRFRNVGTTIRDYHKDGYGSYRDYYYPAQTDIVTVLGFGFTDYGYNITAATWRLQPPIAPIGQE